MQKFLSLFSMTLCVIDLWFFACLAVLLSLAMAFERMDAGYTYMPQWS